MKWQGRRQSSRVADRRGAGGGGGLAVGGLGIGGVLFLLLVSFLTGQNPMDVIGGSGTYVEQPAQMEVQGEGASDELKDFTSTVFADLEDVWGQLFQENGIDYEFPQLVLYEGAGRTACGTGSSAMGPFYCGGDQTVYLSPSFYNDLGRKYGAPGDFAFAYVLAHEVGHHVQNQLGILSQVQSIQQQGSQKQSNEFSVRLELQADYFAGVFAHHIEGKGYLEPGDIKEAMAAAEAVGDDTLQERATGQVIQDNFTHGSAEQRQRWFNKGFESGTIQGGDTYNMPYGDL